MFPRIIDVWPNLVQAVQRQFGDNTEAEVAGQNDQSEIDQQLEVNEQETLHEYRNLYWTRLMIVSNDEDHKYEKWSMGPDIVEECQALTELQRDGEDQWKPLFDPTDFN